MMKSKLFIIPLIITLALSSCSDFLTKYPKDQVYPTSSSDFNELLVGEGYMPASTGADIGGWIHVMDDDVIFVATSISRTQENPFHWWEPAVQTDATWKALYKRIGITNVILDGIDEFKDEEGDGYRKVKGESLFLRGSYYYFLVNIYGLPYRKETCATDPGVPLKLNVEIVDKRFTRNSVEECYNQITSDLKAAIHYLKGLQPTTTYRAGEMAARTLLSRIHLYKGEWEEVTKQCDTILKNKSQTLLDFNLLTSVKTSNAISARSPETFFTNGKNQFPGNLYLAVMSTYFQASDELLRSYTSNDLRRSYFFRGYSNFAPRKLINNDDGVCSDFFLLRLPEVYLNQAEAFAMMGKTSEAITTIQHLRQARLVTGTLDEVHLSGEELINFIRTERRLEFAFEGHRWFDLRRYAVSPKWPYQREIIHPYYEGAARSGNRVLEKYDEEPEYYVMPLPETEIVLNGGALIQNKERKEKQTIQ